MIKQLWNWLLKFFGKKKQELQPADSTMKAEESIETKLHVEESEAEKFQATEPRERTPELLSLEERARQEWLPKPPKPDPIKKLRLRMRVKRLPKPTSRAVHADIGRYMRGKGQHKHYRRSVKARVQPEED